MPEGPEIRRAADKIAKVLVDKPLESVFFGLPELSHWQDELGASQIISLETRGKALLTHFANGLTVYSHNQLYGRWYVSKKGQQPKTGRSLRMAFHTPTHSALLYSASDISVWETPALLQHPFLARIGPDILSDSLDWREVTKILSSSKFSNRGVGAFYLDQGFLAGIGNYLRSEILFFAGVNPWTKPRQLTVKERNQLARVTLDVSRRSYRTGGITNPDSRVRKLKKQGLSRSQYRHAVFGRNGECYVCGTDIIKDTVAARRLYWCPTCQYQLNERL